MRGIMCLVSGVVLGAALGAGLWAWIEPTTLTSPPAFDETSYLPQGMWADLDGDCQDTRTEVLLALGLDVELDAEECRIASGVWQDMFTGQKLSNPADVVIVHIVPLLAAHESGAWAWDGSRKQAFANSYVHATSMSLRPKPPLTSNLATASLATMQAKQGNNIIGWVPERHNKKCAYTENWVTIKAKWELAMNEAESKRVSEILALCP